MGSITVQAVTGLFDLATDAVGDRATVVAFTFDGDLPDDYVLIGTTARATRVFGDIGNQQQKERLEITCHAACWGGDWAPADRFQRANDLVSLIDDAIRDQMNPATVSRVFGIPPVNNPRAMITTIETVTGDTEHGGTDAMIDFTVTVESKIYRTQEGP